MSTPTASESLFHGLDAPELERRLQQLDALADQPRAPAPPKLASASAAQLRDAAAFDVVLLGGGLSLIYAPLLAARGLRVAVVERGRVGRAHREWNASAKELAVLVEHGLFTRSELDDLIVARYRAGRCRWAGGQTTEVTHVLDCAVDAQVLLDKLRTLASARGVTFFEHTEVCEVLSAQDALIVAAQSQADAGPLHLRAHVVLEGRGAASPWAAGDLVCPTVGGVLTGLEQGEAPDQMDPALGDILVTTEDVEEGRQHIWEAFPTRPGEVAVYLFYYAERDTLGRAPLAQLYRRFWRTLGRFKRGEAQLVRPTFGIIPGWSRLAPGPTSPHPRLLLVGDAASRHSPLTFCGFGATLRSIAPGVDAVERLAKSEGQKRLTTSLRAEGVDDRPLHKVTGALALMMARAHVHKDKATLNRLLDASFTTLEQMPNDAYGRLLRDEMAPVEVMKFMWQTSKRYPAVWRLVQRALGLGTMMRWSASVARLGTG